MIKIAEFCRERGLFLTKTFKKPGLRCSIRTNDLLPLPFFYFFSSLLLFPPAKKVGFIFFLFKELPPPFRPGRQREFLLASVGGGEVVCGDGTKRAWGKRKFSFF